MIIDDVCGPEAIAAQIYTAYRGDRLRDTVEDFPDRDVILSMLEAANRFASERIAPFDRSADRGEGCRVVDGRVALPPGQAELWADYRAGGWTAIDIPAVHGGLGLPDVVALGIQELLDRGSIGFGMLSGASRAACRVLADHSDPVLAATWIPEIAAGRWAATICISEADAGSDLGRLKTTARRAGGRWRVTGEKLWTSFGDHPLTDRIGHLVLARTDAGASGTRGLSLFLVPDRCTDGSRNGVFVRRVEEKMGLHCSPTCAMGFEEADAELIGTEGRGLPQLFGMIQAMRLHVATQGLGATAFCLDQAYRYARDREQGGSPDERPVPIIEHADIKLILARLAARTLTLRGLVLAAGASAQLRALDADAGSMLGWLLPIVKNSGAETAAAAASEAMLVFGGAGYTSEWPIEQRLRDARVLAIYEGTTGMQAIDLVRRRWLKPGQGSEVFRAALSEEASLADASVRAVLARAIALFDEACGWLRSPDRSALQIDAACRSALVLATELAHGWMAARLVRLGWNDRVRSLGLYGLSAMEEALPGAMRAMQDGEMRTEAFYSPR